MTKATRTLAIVRTGQNLLAYFSAKRRPHQYAVEIDCEEDGRWIADIPELSGVMVYGASDSDALKKIQTLALSVTAKLGYHAAMERTLTVDERIAEIKKRLNALDGLGQDTDPDSLMHDYLDRLEERVAKLEKERGTSHS
jgi:hypothetical protein